MIETAVSVGLFALGLYSSLGIVFALPFIFFGVKKIDPAAAKGTVGFKLLILPGCVIFWPTLLWRWAFHNAMPVEYSSHRRVAKGEH